MDPTICIYWEAARDELEKAKAHLKAGESELAKAAAKDAAVGGLVAVVLLLRGREDDKKAAEVAFDRESIDDWERTCSRPQDYIAEAEKCLKHYSELSPPENKLLL